MLSSVTFHEMGTVRLDGGSLWRIRLVAAGIGDC